MEFHQPVLLREVIELLNIKKDKKYIDATVGGGGHAEAILRIGGQVLGIDWDPEAVKHSKEYLEEVCPGTSWKIVCDSFVNLEKIAKKEGFSQVLGILFDLGVSSHQLLGQKRGFSFQKNAPLDMRMDPKLAVTAADLLKVLSKKQLYALFTKFAQENRARAIANAIVRARGLKPIKTSRELADLVVTVYDGKRKVKGLHPATKVFLALRIAVNSELENLKAALPQAVSLLRPGGRLAVISFHESEDRIVKRFFKETKRLKILFKKPITPSEEEIKINPRSRSAKLRVAGKV
jgi:16S rRNA (cytosine1402-N4)-methyltransferase